MTITWDLNELGIVSLTVPDEAVLAHVEALQLLGFSPSVAIDNDSERV